MNKVAIIILNWNSAEITIDCLKSVLNINYDNFEVFLVDNGSVDGSISTIKNSIKSNLIHFISLKKNYGYTGGNNIAINMAKNIYNPDYFLLLNNDTIVDRNFLLNLVKPFLVDKTIGITVPKIFYYEPSNYIYYAGGYINLLSGLGEHYFGKKIDQPKKTNIAKNVGFANGCSMLIKKELISKVGLLDEAFFANIEDVDYSYRTLKKGYSIHYNPEAFLWHKEGYASKKNIGNWFRIYLCTRNIILFQKKRINFLSFFPFVFYFFFRWFLYMEIKHFIKKDYKSCKVIFLGIYDGFSSRIRYIN